MSESAGVSDGERASEHAGLARLQRLLGEMGGLLATLLEPGGGGSRECERTAEPRGASSAARLAAAGPRTDGRRAEYELLVEAIYEGYLLHYGSPRVLHVPPGEEGLGLLAGDQLYAIGLARLVAIGDTLAVCELADTITLSALAHAAGRPPLAEAVWDAGARAVGWGASETHRKAKELVCAGRPQALDAMRTSASLGGR